MEKVFIAALLIIGIASYAQNRTERPSRDQIEQMTPEQRTQIHLKKLTLDLDLNTSQQEQIGKILAEQSANRETMRANRKVKMEAVKANRFEMRNKMLDEQIEMKNKMKGILSPEQYTKWETLREKNKEKMGERREKRKENKMD
jgi:Spy/CpxP family protein refolding chaperone